MSILRISARAADRLRAGHLWVYRSDIESSTDELAPGSLVTLTDARNLPLGTALYSTSSQIAARLVSRTPGINRNQYLADLRSRIDAALALRRQLAPVTADNNAQRLIFSEADNLPGIVADRYNDLVLVQLLTQGTAQDDVRAVLAATLADAFAAEPSSLTVWERPDPRIRELEQLPVPPPGPLFTHCHPDLERIKCAEAEVPASLAGTALSDRHPERSEGPASSADAGTPATPTTTTFTLNGLRFHYDAAAGQKTGAFLDQRLNYAAAARVVQSSGHTKRASARGLRALDICTYHGGFALHLAQVCARVTGVDTSRSALEAADRNLLLNPSIAASCDIDWIEADAFDYLRHLGAHPGTPTMRGASSAHGRDTNADIAGHLFDAIVLDPPAFAKSKRAADSAARGYKELNLRALRLLAPGGTLIANSCSHHVSLQDFTAIVASAAADAGRRVQLLETRAAAPDHPEVLTLPETRYLKCLICRVD